MDWDSIIHKDSTNLNPKRGDLLISEPLLDEPFFKRSVVLLLEEDEDNGHIGLILNKKTSVTLQELFPEWEAAKGIPIYCGGLVESDRLFMLHNHPELFADSLQIAPGIYVGAKIDDIMDYINNYPEKAEGIRFFLGYSGWSKDQLASEILGNTWALRDVPSSNNLLSGYGNEYWRRVVESMGADYKSWLIVPPDPSFN